MLPVSLDCPFKSKLLFYSVFQAGLKPICEFMTFNFSMQAIDQKKQQTTVHKTQYRKKIEQQECH
jgi:pyruvate/2-oxoglutarate/acetoin dehydrogenase E1 component